MENKFVSMVVYLHNEEKNIVPFLDVAVDAIGNLFKKYEIICVDDACSDGTVENIKKYTYDNKLDSIVSVVHMGFYQGIEPSMNAGRDIAIGDLVYEFDHVIVDYDKSLIEGVYNEMVKGYDIVAASNIRAHRFTSRVFYNLFNRCSKSFAKIGPETFRIVSRRAINRIKTIGSHIPYRKAVYANCGLNMTTITYEPVAGFEGNNSKASFSERGGLALDTFIYFTNVMERASAILSAGFLLATVVCFVYAIVDHFMEQNVASGWPSMMGFMSIGFFGVFALLTIVLKYLSVLLNLVFRQQRYMVADIEKVVGK
ncbi:MAG: glycosyltransferase [Butyrivibrio sp.]|uniref:glycosyltransferase n=1 Tax=Butyrivibrio sp. TaxID=28121 RepID=UPI0025BD06B4|nr:glycosyltransferase [Butyrivibrio sp.]MBQ6588708.1 glycosyltransferase [Butyrivibrio sp.]